MKERDVRRRKTVKAGEVFEHSTIELNDQRLRVDQRRREGATVVLREIPNGRRRVRTWRLNSRKNVTLCLR